MSLSRVIFFLIWNSKPKMNYWQAIVNEEDDDYKNVDYRTYPYPPRPTEEDAIADVYDYAIDKFIEEIDGIEEFERLTKLYKLNGECVSFDDDDQPVFHTEDFTKSEIIEFCHDLTRRGTYTGNRWSYSIKKWEIKPRSGSNSKRRKTKH